VVVKSDTTEFSAASFKVKKNATVEDVFKKMPGIEVSKNGSLKVQGEIITQIYVDGKPFFGTDLKAVTQNFPADLIDKIQIIDKKSDQALATKVDDGQYEKIINITLKKNRNKGVFGKDYIGYGTKAHYEAKANANFFNNDKKLSVIAGANNTGRDDSHNNNGSYNNSNGITDNKQIKMNYAGKLGNNFDFSAWAGYEQNKTTIDQVINRQNIFSDSSTDYAENNKSGYLTKNIYGGLYFEYKPDTFTLIRFNESAGYTNNSYQSFSAFNSTAFNGYKINKGFNQSSGLSKVPVLNGQVNYYHRLSNSGRNIFLNFSNNINSNQTNTYNSFNNYFYPVDSSSYTLLLNQYQNNNTRNTTFGTTISYSEPVAPNNTLNFSYTYNYSNNNMPKEVYDFNAQTGLYNLFNDSLSNHFDNYTYGNTASFNYNYSSKKNGFGIGMRWKELLTQSHSFEKDSVYQQTFTGVLPSLNFYSAGKGKRLNIYYNFYVKAPQAYQLQPLIDNTNPLYLRLGNPDLKYASVQTLRFNFNYYNTKKERGFNSNANFSTISNNISTSIIFDNTGKQISQPVNTDGAYNWNAWFSYFEPVYLGNDKIKWNINLLTSGSKIINQLNGKENLSRNNFIKVFFGLTYDTPEWIDLHTDFSISRQAGEYSLQPNFNNTLYCLNISPNL
ncbi:MAG TPA: outer membrane beta-barrel protein, partial [Chitinophagaceae bacterium]|nr:outer membrane beta-barrel protein [Chitinophagaceae bacterium]